MKSFSEEVNHKIALEITQLGGRRGKLPLSLDQWQFHHVRYPGKGRRKRWLQIRDE